MRPLSIRASLTLWFFGLTTLLVAAFSATLYLGVERTLASGLDAVLRARADALVSLCEWDDEKNAVELEASHLAASDTAIVAAGRGAEVWVWPSGRLLHRSGELMDVKTMLPADGGSEAVETVATLPGPSPRRLLARVGHHAAAPATGDEPARPEFDVIVRVTESLAPMEAQLAQVRWVIGVLAALAVAVVLLFGFFLSRRFVRPLRELGDAASAMRAGARAALPRRGNGDEIDVLAEILDGAFAALQASLGRQTRFTANAAHELRNPIAVIRNAAEVALRRERTGPEYRAFLADVVDTSKRMGDIVEALLILARMDAGTVGVSDESVDLAAVARASAAAHANGNSRVEVSNGAPVPVRGDARLLRILVDNLVANALRYTRPETSVEVGVAADRAGASLTVRDHGPGVPASETTRLFERFYRVEPTGSESSGAGLGLAIVDEIARAHSARCAIESSEAGTAVTVSFPSGSGGA